MPQFASLPFRATTFLNEQTVTRRTVQEKTCFFFWWFFTFYLQYFTIDQHLHKI